MDRAIVGSIFLLLFCFSPLEAGETGFVFVGRGATGQNRAMTLVREGPAWLVHKGVADADPIFRLVTKSDEVTLESHFLPITHQTHLLRRFGDWIYLVKGATFQEKAVLYSIYTHGGVQSIYKGFAVTGSIPSVTIIRQKERVFSIHGNSQQTTDVHHTTWEQIERDFLQRGYQTGNGSIEFTLEKGIGPKYVYSGLNHHPEATLLTLDPYRPDAAVGLAFILTPKYTYFDPALAVPFIFSATPIWEVRRETLIEIYLLMYPPVGPCVAPGLF